MSIARGGLPGAREPSPLFHSPVSNIKESPLLKKAERVFRGGRQASSEGGGKNREKGSSLDPNIHLTLLKSEKSTRVGSSHGEHNLMSYTPGVKGNRARQRGKANVKEVKGCSDAAQHPKGQTTGSYKELHKEGGGKRKHQSKFLSARKRKNLRMNNDRRGQRKPGE